MFKNICARAIVPVALTVTGFVVVCCILLYGAIKRDMVNDAVRHSAALADTIIESARYAMLRSDWESIGNIVKNIGAQKGVEHVRIFDPKGLILFSKDPKEIHQIMDKSSAGCIGCHAGPVPRATLAEMQKARTFVNKRQVKVLAITAPIANEPACSTAVCHFHSSAQKQLGILDIGLDRAPLERALAVMRGRMLLFSLMILILTVGGVAALLRRNVFVPIRLLTDFTDRVVDGNLKDNCPEVDGDLERLADNLRQMVLQHNLAVTRLRQMEKRTGRRTSRGAQAPADGCGLSGQERIDGHSAAESPELRKKSGSDPSLSGNPEEDS